MKHNYYIVELHTFNQEKKCFESNNEYHIYVDYFSDKFKCDLLEKTIEDARKELAPVEFLLVKRHYGISGRDVKVNSYFGTGDDIECPFDDED